MSNSMTSSCHPQSRSGSLLAYILICCLSFAVFAVALPHSAAAQDDIGSWDGALWRFELTPRPGNRHKGNLVGRFRVAGLKIYQSEGRDDKELTKEVGESVPGPGKRPTKTTVTVEDFRARNDKKELVKGIKGIARLERIDKDNNRGEFIDKDGFKWTMKCIRVQE